MGIKEKFFSKITKMKYVAAYALLVLSGKSSPSADDLTKFMKASGCDVNADNVKSVVDALKGKELHEVINAGFGKISSLSMGGGSSQGSGSGPAQPAQQAKAEEKKAEPEPEDDDEDMDLGDLFGYAIIIV